MAMGVRADDVDDCVQDSMLALLTVRSEVRDQASYALGIARHLAFRETRRAIAERMRGDMEQVELRMPSREPDALSQLERRETLALANSVLRAIPAQGREILRRFYFRGETAAQICDALGISMTVFRLEKSRVKAMFLERIKRASAFRMAA